MVDRAKRIYNIIMPRYRELEWQGYTVRIAPPMGDVSRQLPLMPFFWDTDIHFDMIAESPKDMPKTTELSLKYKWELLDLDDRVIRSGQNNYVFNPITSTRKHHAIEIGFLKPQQCYRLNITLTDIYGSTSEPLPILTFTVKDRDEVYMQIVVALVGIVVGIILGFVLKGCL